MVKSSARIYFPVLLTDYTLLFCLDSFAGLLLSECLIIVKITSQIDVAIHNFQYKKMGLFLILSLEETTTFDFDMFSERLHFLQ